MNKLILISDGEILDKFSILNIKQKKIIDQNKLININNEINSLQNISLKIILSNSRIEIFYAELTKINEKIWTIEDNIRKKEKLQQFDSEFIELARSVYRTNDQRANIKKQINIISESNLIEEKSYEQY